MLNGRKWTICLSLAGGLVLAGALAVGAQDQAATSPATDGASSSSSSIVGDCVKLPGQDTITANELKRFLDGYEEIAKAQVETPGSALDAKIKSRGFERQEFFDLKRKLMQGSTVVHRVQDGDTTVGDSDRKGLNECELELIRANLPRIDEELSKNFTS